MALWLAGVLLVLGRLVLGTARVLTLARAADRVTDPSTLALAQRVADRLGISRPVTLLRGDRLDVPITWGVVYPVVLLPAESENWPEERLRLVLMHEMAHVKRFDALTQFIAQLAIAVFWFDPLVWLAARRMRVEREHACDDYVLRDGTRPSHYASELLEMVRRLGLRRGNAAAPAFAALAMARRTEFEGRMLAILDPVADRHTLGRAVSAASALVALALVVPLAALRPFEERGGPAVRPARAAVATGFAPATVPVSASLPRGVAARAATTVPLTVPVDRRAAAALASSGVAAGGGATATFGAASPAAGMPAAVMRKTSQRCSPREMRERGSGTSREIRGENHGGGNQVFEYVTRGPGRCVHIVLVGEFTLTDDERDIARLGPGGRARLHEVLPGSERELTIVPDDGGALRRTYIENGRPAEYSASAREWVASLVREIAREAAVNVRARVTRFRARGGVPAVLEEIASIGSTGAKRTHYEALLSSGALTGADLETIVRHAGRELRGSSGDLRAVLRRVPPGGVRTIDAALEEAISRMSDGDKRAVLAGMLDTADPSTLLVIIRLSERIGSDGDKSSLLRRAAPRVLDGSTAALREAFFRAYSTIGSDGDKHSVLLAALRQGQRSPALTRDVIRAAARIGADGDKASVLLAVARGGLLTTEELRAEYVRTARTIGADGDYRAVIDAMLGGKTGP